MRFWWNKLEKQSSRRTFKCHPGVGRDPFAFSNGWFPEPYAGFKMDPGLRRDDGAGARGSGAGCGGPDKVQFKAAGL